MLDFTIKNSFLNIYSKMNIEPLLKNISKHVILNDTEIELVSNFWREKKINRGEYILRNGETCKYDSYILNGAVKAFYIDSGRGTEKILFLGVEDWWASDIHSFSTNTKSIFNIQAIENTTLLQISQNSYDKMILEIPKLEKYFRKILESYLGTLQRRIVANNTLCAEKRYLEFIIQYPKLSERFPQYLIASYLNISPEMLSRIKNRLPLN